MKLLNAKPDQITENTSTNAGSNRKAMLELNKKIDFNPSLELPMNKNTAATTIRQTNAAPEKLNTIKRAFVERSIRLTP
jgi:hypothetical protein